MSDDELVEMLGGGNTGWELLAKIRKAAKGGFFASRCCDCGRPYLHFGYAHLPVTMRVRDVLIGPRETSRCRECSPSAGATCPTTPG